MSTQATPFRFSIWLQAGTLALALGSLSLAGCKPDKADAAAKNTAGAKSGDKADKKDGKDDQKVEAVPVEVASVSRRPISASYSGTASLEAPNEAQVVAKTSGVMVQLLAEEGDTVHAGQVLARIDPEQTRLEAQRQLATVHKLENNYRRSQELAAQKLVSADANDQIRYELESARASYQMANLQLSYTNITAPISGVIAQRMAKPGNLINLNAPVFRIVNISHLEGVLNVPEREMSTLKAGMPVQMSVDAIAGKTFGGKIDRVSPVVDSGSGTFRVVCSFDNVTQLRPGMFGRIEVVYDQHSDALTIPRIALLEDEGEPAVFVVRANKAVRTSIGLGYTNGEIAEVRSGLKEGDAVVTAGKVAIRDGSAVQVIAAAAAKPALADNASAGKAAR